MEVPKGRVGKTLRDLPMSPSVGSDNTSWDMLISHKIDPSPLFFGQEIPLVAQVVGFHHRQSRITQKKHSHSELTYNNIGEFLIILFGFEKEKVFWMIITHINLNLNLNK